MTQLILCLSLGFNIPFHAGHMAEYYYQYDGVYLNLEVTLEKHELLNFTFKEECDFKNMTALCMAQYINQNTFVSINDEKLAMELQGSHTDGDHIIIDLRSKFETAAVISSVVVENQCFYEFDRGFKNRVIIDIGSFQKSYLLNRRRHIVSLKL